jgi:hypothetical protein
MDRSDEQALDRAPAGATTRQIPQTAAELTAYGWDLATAALARAESDRVLVTHWFHTAEDSSVNTDEHFGSNSRTTNFVHLVLPTLADQLDASHLVAAVPWDAQGEPALLVLVAWIRGESAMVDARALSRRPAGEVNPPWWALAAEATAPPSELVQAARSLARNG